MAQQIINLGATGSGAGGDSARTAFEKAIANFAELYIAALPGTAAQKKAARDMFGLGDASTRAVLGTVSQSSGVPTGAIIERGSNANGEYTRYADGTQECWVRGSTGVDGFKTFTFPAPFVNSNVIGAALLTSSSASAITAKRGSNNASSYTLYFIQTATTGATSLLPADIPIDLIFKGRWY